jgi:hypothetical protein
MEKNIHLIKKTVLIYTDVDLLWERRVEDDNNCSSSCKIRANCSSLLVSSCFDDLSISS